MFMQKINESNKEIYYNAFYTHFSLTFNFGGNAREMPPLLLCVVAAIFTVFIVLWPPADTATGVFFLLQEISRFYHPVEDLLLMGACNHWSRFNPIVPIPHCSLGVFSLGGCFWLDYLWSDILWRLFVIIIKTILFCGFLMRLLRRFSTFVYYMLLIQRYKGTISFKYWKKDKNILKVFWKSH